MLFVGIENGEWLRWLAERHGFIGFTTHRDDVVEHVYSVSGEPLSAVALAEMWALELNQPERAGRIRIFALFPASFRDEVAAAIHRAGGTGGTFRVSFSSNELHVAASTPASQATH